jgi:hypothetical protein
MSVIAAQLAVPWPIVSAALLMMLAIPLHHRHDLLRGCRRWSWSSMARQAGD